MGGEDPTRVALPAGSLLLNSVYEVQAQLGHGGFGIVYKALHRDLGSLVAIKEYFPAELSVREDGMVHPRSKAGREDFAEGLHRFLEEAKRLTEFKDVPSVVTCRDFFRENGTAYLVMDYVEGMSLANLLALRERARRPFGEADLLAVIVPLLGGLKAVHEAGVLHRDIKPSNILIRQEAERPVLIDFGAAKQTLAGVSRTYAPYTEGFAAIEQVGQGKLGPWTDLYAVGAVMWRMVAGGAVESVSRQPVKVEARLTAFLRGQADPLPPAREVGAGRFPERILTAIDRCLELREEDRVQDCADLVGLLQGSGRVAEERSNVHPDRSRSTARWLVALVTGTVAATLLAVVLGVPERSLRGLRPGLDGDRFRDCDSCPEMVVVDGGSFMMGSPAYENDREDDEGPRRRVTISGPLAVGVYEVTKEQYGRFVDDAGHDGGSACRTHESGEWDARTGRSWTNPGFRQGRQEPAVCVSWNDAQAYVKWLSGKTGEKYRLPTEAEWEYVARGTSETRFSYGDDPDYTRTCGYGNMADQVGADHYRWAGVAPCRDGYVHTAPVGSFSRNAFGLHDVHGNVWEWVQDWYGSYPSGAATDPRGPATGSDRVLRGGSWGDGPRYGRSAYRFRLSPGDRNSVLGFRVLRTIP